MTRDLSRAAGRRVRDDIDVDEGPSRDYALCRRGLIERAASERAARRRMRRVLPASALMASVLLLCLAGYGAFEAWRQRGLGFVAGEASQAGRVGAYYGANAGAPLALRFEDGSRIRVEESGGLRVANIGATNVAVQLETGSAQFEIRPRGAKTWDVFAGPYRVRVTGTAFSLSWNVPEQSLELQMRSGAVVVSGPGIESGQRVSGAERFVSRVTTSRSASGATAARAIEEQLEAGSEEPLARGTEEQLEARTEQPARATSELTPWSSDAEAKAPSVQSKLAAAAPLKHDGERPQPLDAAASEPVLASGSSEQLMALADSARFSGRIDLAERALRTVRRRFVGSPAAASAAFLLGKMAEDAGNLASAASHYDAHLRESGQLVPEASGRKMLVLYRLGDINGARAAAKEYLKRFPEGPYARQARELISR
jgi:transmembrane sensor